MLGLAYQQIATSLSTVWRVVKKFQAEGTVSAKYCSQKIVLKKPAAYKYEVIPVLQ